MTSVAPFGPISRDILIQDSRSKIPRSRNQDPEINIRKSKSGNQDPEIKIQKSDPEIKIRKSTSRNQHPEIKIQKSRSKNQDPEINIQKSRSGNQDPEIKIQKSRSGNQDPKIKIQKSLGSRDCCKKPPMTILGLAGVLFCETSRHKQSGFSYVLKKIIPWMLTEARGGLKATAIKRVQPDYHFIRVVFVLFCFFWQKSCFP